MGRKLTLFKCAFKTFGCLFSRKFFRDQRHQNGLGKTLVFYFGFSVTWIGCLLSDLFWVLVDADYPEPDEPWDISTMTFADCTVQEYLKNEGKWV